MNDASPTAITRTHQLGHSWGNQALLDQLNLAIPAGVTLVRGDEQTGKTTLLHLLSGQLAPTQGWVETQGCRADQQATAYAEKVFRTDPLHPSLDQTSPAQWFDTLPARYPLFTPSALTGLVNGFGLMPHMDKPLYMLSTGSRRKVWLSAAFASGAALILIDQPFAALDGPSMRLVREVLQDFSHQSGQACVVADYEPPADVVLACAIDL
jgi:ABC-type multidrug transport system ATPase subunit